MDTGKSHIPFRAAKLTMVLRDTFMSSSDLTRIVMIACISPGNSSADHSINTLRYAARLKENPGENYDNPDMANRVEQIAGGGPSVQDVVKRAAVPKSHRDGGIIPQAQQPQAQAPAPAQGPSNFRANHALQDAGKLIMGNGASEKNLNNAGAGVGTKPPVGGSGIPQPSAQPERKRA